MKRIVFILCALALLLSLGACGRKNQNFYPTPEDVTVESLKERTTPQTMLGFEGAMIFFAAITATIGIYLRSNALDKVQDPKLVAIDLKVFKTDRIFDFGAFGVIAILTILYIALW